MTITADGARHVGARRFDARPLSVTRPRHRRAEPFALAVLAQLVELVRAALDATAKLWIARAAVVVAVSAFLVAAMLLGSVLVLVEPLRAGPGPMVVTPSSTPFPDGWTYEGTR